MINVLVSTYDGIDFFDEQLNSLLRQNYKEIKILIRDDGSSDPNFIEYLQNIKNPDILIKFEKNIGVVKSFFTLLQTSDDEANYYAFCDQDDVWLPEKIDRAVLFLNENKHIPCLYCSDAYLVDKKLSGINRNFMHGKQGFALKNVLIRNSSLGCTCVINKKLRDLILKSFPDLNNVIMHDWWCAIIAAAFGKIVYDNQKTVLYRQHDNNQIGAGKNADLKRIKKIFARKNNTNLLPQIYEFCKFYKNITGDKSSYESLFEKSNNFLSRFKYSLLFSYPEKTRTFLFRLLFTLGYYKFSKQGGES